MSTLIRVFQAEAKPGREQAFQDFFTGEALRNVQAHNGLVSARVGLPTPETPRSFCMITRWSSVEGLKSFAGEDWTQPVIDPVEAPLLEAVRVIHFLDAAEEISSPGPSFGTSLSEEAEPR